jgi:hypothetical protein
MVSDFFYPQPGGVESHIYQLSTVRRHSYLFDLWTGTPFWSLFVDAAGLEVSFKTKQRLTGNAEIDRQRPQSGYNNARLLQPKPDWNQVPHEPSQGLPSPALGGLPLHYVPDSIQRISTPPTDFHPRTDPNRSWTCLSQQPLPRGSATRANHEPAHRLHRPQSLRLQRRRKHLGE